MANPVQETTIVWIPHVMKWNPKKRLYIELESHEIIYQLPLFKEERDECIAVLEEWYSKCILIDELLLGGEDEGPVDSNSSGS